MHVIYVFGDSITYGAWDMGSAGWTAKLRSYLDERNNEPTYYFYPLGIHGETTNGLMKRFDNELEARRRKDDTSYTFIFAYGANDATWLTGEERFKSTLKDYEQNLIEVAERARKLTSNIFFVDITPVNEEYSADLLKRNKSCLNTYIDTYNAKLYEAAAANNVEVIGVNEALKKEGVSETFVEDGLHPNALGHAIIFEQVKNSIEPLLQKLEK